MATSLTEAVAAIKSDAYFVNDETHVQQVRQQTFITLTYGVNPTLQGVSGKTHKISYLNCTCTLCSDSTGSGFRQATRVMRQQPGCYTMIEILASIFFPGDRGMDRPPGVNNNSQT